MRHTMWFILACVFIASCKEEKPSEVLSDKKTQQSEVPKVKVTPQKLKTILFFGNSLTAGYGLSLVESFPSLIQAKLDSAHLPYKTVNAGLSGETSAGGLSRIDWVLKQSIDVFVLELGANDALRGLGLKQTKENLQKILSKVKEKYPNVKIVIAGMQIPPSMGKEYTEGFKKIYEELAKDNNAVLIPFLLEHVAGNPSLNQQDGIHPTAAGTKIVAANVWSVLKEIL